MAPSNAGALASCDWNPFLLKAPELIHSLGFCAALAATRAAAQIKLSGQDIEYPALASNLVAITTLGQDAFLKAFADMLEIASKTNNMGKIGGLLDQVVERFSDPSAERSTKRLLNRLQSDIDICEASGKRTTADFRLWQQKVRSLREAVHRAQTETHESLEETENIMKSLAANQDRTRIDLDKAQKEADVAQTKQGEALVKQFEREAELNSITAQAGKMALAFSFGMLGVVAGVGTSLYLSASAASSVARAEAELERQRQKARDLDYVLQTVAAGLESYARGGEGLGVLMRQIVNMLMILEALTDNIQALIFYFSRINGEIKSLVNEHETIVKEIVNDKANGIQMEDVDYKDFQDKALEMKKYALNVHALSTLYSTVITDVINPGFSLAMKSSHYAEGSTELAIANKQQGLKLYLADAEKMCSESSLKANKTLNDRLDELDRAHQRQTPRRATTGVPLAIAPSITPHTLLDTNRNRRFSRLNPFRRDR